MMKKNKGYTLAFIKALGKEKSKKNLSKLIDMYTNEELEIDLRREVVSSIGRQNDNDRIFAFIQKNVFDTRVVMTCVYQMYRTCLYKKDFRFDELGEKIRGFYKNEVLDRMYFFYKNKGKKRKRIRCNIDKPTLLVGDTCKTLDNVTDNSVQLIFTSPPYYNARIYSDYHSYQNYLNQMKAVFKACYSKLEDGRFFIVNVSPVITKRPGREFESIRYPIHFDLHRVLTEVGYYFVDEIIWIKPEPSVANRNGGYMQTRKALSYKPNCITESIMVYRKDAPFLLDVNVGDYKEYDRYEHEEIDTSNCWYIAPKSNKDHPAVFPEELCRRILKYYSFEGDVILDPFAGSGTFGRVAMQMNRIPIMCEIDEKYTNNINKKDEYDIRR